MNETIHFIITGGTIDSYYDTTKDTAVPNPTSIIPSVIKSLKLHINPVFTEICIKDSRSIDEKDRENIVKAIESSQQKRIIITHGTYTMAETAKYILSHLKRRDQTIVITGYMIPINGFSDTDGLFNLGFALAKTQELPSGIYVSMNGAIFLPDDVIKLVNEGRFVPKDTAGKK